MILIMLKVKPEVEEKVVKYLNMNEVDSFNVDGGNFFVLTHKYPNDVLENCKNFLKLMDVKFVKNMLIVSPVLNVAFQKAEFDRLKKTYTPT